MSTRVKVPKQCLSILSWYIVAEVLDNFWHTHYTGGCQGTGDLKIVYYMAGLYHSVEIKLTYCFDGKAFNKIYY